MIKIYNQTQNKVENQVFWHMLEVFEFLIQHEYGKEDTLIIYTIHNEKQTTILKIEDWGHTPGGIDTYMKRFWKIK